ncbi:MAG: hypothetical protein QY332_01335 [Anaerolineales bacterium]|nr:MAG: hypothetical protein QY332_01335 [Anaerolineales bacterium]
MNGKSEKIEDQKEVWRIRWQAVRVIVKGTLAGLAMTALAMLIP